MALLIALCIALVATWWLSSDRSRLRIMDHPNERSLHEQPVPRTGGLAILAAIAAGWGWLSLHYGMQSPFGWIVAAVVAVASISLLDDLYDLPAKVRFLAHLLAAILILLGGVVLPWGGGGWVVTLLAVVWMINLYNFMDGMDGFAGGMALFGFGFLGFGGYLAGDIPFALFCWTVAAATAGFLLFNFPPARIFMGDAGSATLGAVAAALSLWGIHEGLFPLWFPLLIFSPFVVDATVTLLRRGLRGEKVWQAHRQHYYQRLVQAGWGHRKTVLAEYLLMLITGSSAIVILGFSLKYQLVALGIWTMVYVVLALFVDRKLAGFLPKVNKRGG